MALHTDDVLAIQQLAAAYCHLIDDGDGEALADLFTDDGTLEIVDLVTSEGREQLVANGGMFPDVMPGGRHIVHNTWITGDGDTATMRAYLSNVQAGESPRYVQTGRYVDDLVKTGDGWRFRHRTLTLDGPLF